LTKKNSFQQEIDLFPFSLFPEDISNIFYDFRVGSLRKAGREDFLRPSDFLAGSVNPAHFFRLRKNPVLLSCQIIRLKKAGETGNIYIGIYFRRFEFELKRD
jgi:hypothetical protein